MNDTEQLITALAEEAKPVSPLAAPRVLAVRLTGLLLVYALALGEVLGWREDLWLQLERPLYLAELTMLFLLVVTSITAAVYRAFPDLYQHPAILHWPAYALVGFGALLLAQFLLPFDPAAAIGSGAETHGMECTLCIGAVAIIPSAAALWLLRRGASTYPLMSGAHALLAAAATGCLVLRLIEMNDIPAHLLAWHYLPTAGFSLLGGVLGRRLLQW